MSMRATINDFLAQRAVALVGVSRDGGGFGNAVYKELAKKNYSVHIVHPQATKLHDQPCYKSLSELAGKVTAVMLVTPPEQTGTLVRQAHEAGIRCVWMQPGAESQDAISYCEQAGMSVVHHQCILMFAEPAQLPHRIHRGIKRIMGRLPS